MIDALSSRLGGSRIAPLLLAAGIGRIHVAGLGVALLLLVESATGSLGAAGTAVGAMSLGVGATRPVQGRLIDRTGRRIIAWACMPHAVVAAVLLVADTSSGYLLVGLAFALGFTCPALSVATRAVIAATLPAPRQPSTLGADTALQDVAFTAGPLLAGAVATAASAPAALLVLVVIGCGGALAVAVLAPLHAAPARRSAYARPALRPIARPLVLTIGHGTVYGALGVAGVAVALESAGEHLAGPAVAAVFAGGLVGDLLIAPRRGGTPIRARLQARTAGLLGAVAFAAAAPSAALFIVALVLCGTALAVVGVTVLLDVASRSGERGRAEAFGWTGATLRLGDAVGASCAGFVAEAFGGRAALLVALAGAAAAVATANLRSGTRIAPAPDPVAASPSEATPRAFSVLPAFSAMAVIALVIAWVSASAGWLIAAGAVLLVLLGAALGRLRFALVPLVAGAALAGLAVLMPPPDIDTRWAPVLAMMLAAIGAGASLCLALGALIRRAGRQR